MARSFSGSTQYLGLTNPIGMLADAAWTFGCWVWLDVDNDNQVVMQLGSGTGERGLIVIGQDTGVLSVSPWWNGPSLPNDGTWVRLTICHNGSGINTIRINYDGVEAGSALIDPFTEITTGDFFALGGPSVSYFHTLDGRMAGAFWLHGVALSAAAGDTYLQDLCSLLPAYGAGGSVTADALKGLWLLQDSNPGLDISGTGNNLTNVSTTDIADPSGVPSSCGGGGGSSIPGNSHFRFNQLIFL